MSEKPLRSVFEVYSVILFRGCWNKKKSQLFLYEFTLMQRLMPSHILQLICIPFPPLKKTCRFVPSGTALRGCRGETISGCREMGRGAGGRGGGDKEWRLLLSAGTSSKWNHLAVWSPLGSLLLSLWSSSVAGRQAAPRQSISRHFAARKMYGRSTRSRSPVWQQCVAVVFPQLVAVQFAR